MNAQIRRPALSAALPLLGSGIAFIAMLTVGLVSLAATMMGAMSSL